MHELPAPVRELAAGLEREHGRVLCLRLAGDYRLAASHGDPVSFGLGGLRDGRDVRRAAPWLDHLDPDAHLTLPFVSVPGGRAVHVHAIPARAPAGEGDGGGWYVLLADAGEALQRLRGQQQPENEQRLRMQRVQGRLIEAAAERELWRDQASQVREAGWRLAGSLSHELRTPLSAIVGYARLLGEALADRPAEREQLRAIERGAEHIGSLIEATLAQYRQDASELALHRHPTDLRSLVGQLTELMAPLAADKALGFAAFVAPALPRCLQLDAVRVRQILLNLLGNAIKYTERGRVRLDAAWQAGELTLAVSDTGPGIEAADRERIFEAFQRASPDARRAGAGVSGSGLGLHITRTIVERMDGAITLVSTAGEGSCFSVRIPAQAVAPARRGRSADPAPGRVLVAEDDPDLRALFAVVLERAGFDAQFVGSGREALREALARPPQLMLLDLNLEDEDEGGLAVARRLRQAGYHGAILAMSAADAAIAPRALEAGCDAFAAKPLRPEALLERVLELLRSRP